MYIQQRAKKHAGAIEKKAPDIMETEVTTML